jgi:hypothetical protein
MLNLPERTLGPIGAIGSVGPLGAPVSEEMRKLIMEDVESMSHKRGILMYGPAGRGKTSIMRPPKADPLVPIFSWRNIAIVIVALLLLFASWMVIAMSLMDDDDTPRDAHGVPCTVSLECQ